MKRPTAGRRPGVWAVLLCVCSGCGPTRFQSLTAADARPGDGSPDTGDTLGEPADGAAVDGEPPPDLALEVGPSDTGPPSPPVDAPVASTGSAFFDSCFADLRPLVGRSQVATKQFSLDGYALRIALEADRSKPVTEGSVAWQVVRIAVAIPKRTTCFKDEAALKDLYKPSPHNCADTLTVSQDGINYRLLMPDTDPSRGTTTLSIVGSIGVPPLKMITLSCTGESGKACTSGGPCP